jgi:two-component system sensor histidine kinase RegB
MWVAFGVAAVFIETFVTRVSRELGRARAVAQRNERLASLATLATGAAHELATPLSTIAVVARELERGLDGAPLADVRLIRSEVDRCREILTGLAADAGATTGEGFVAVRARELLEAAQSGLKAAVPIRLAAADAAELELYLPVRAAAQALRGVLKNAQQASPPGAPVEVRARPRGDALEITVEDRGAGMSPEVASRAGEPFYTTKAPGEGMGLGLFLTRVVLERLGGSIAVHSARGRGTRVVMTVPAATNRRTLAAGVAGHGEA